MEKFKYIALIIIILSLFYSCKEKDDPDDNPDNNTGSLSSTSLNRAVYQIMKQEAWYLWYDKVPDILPTEISDSFEYFESLLYTDLDKWSYMITEEQYNQYFVEGAYTGFGFSFDIDDENNMWVRFVFDDSPFGRLGITRGFEITRLNGSDIEQLINDENFYALLDNNNSVNFEFRDIQGNSMSHTITKTEVSQNTVLLDTVYTINNIQTGYLVFHTFIEPSIDELASSFNHFKEQQVTQLIVDLRYNGGGQVNVMNYLGNLMAGKAHTGEILMKYKYNALHNEMNNNQDNIVYLEPEDNSIQLDKIIFITSEESASASEALINGLKPFYDVMLIGNNTHGKPVGMNGFKSSRDKMYIFPITFKTVNKNSQGDYFEGIPANAYVSDDIHHKFGDIEELRLKEALYYLEYGIFSEGILAKSQFKMGKRFGLTGFRRQIGAF